MRYLSRQSGFTLIELILVMVLIGMAAALTAVSIGRSADKAVIRDEAKGMRGALVRARQVSLMERVPVEFILDAERGQYRVSKWGNKVIYTHVLSKRVTADGDESIVFFPKGNSTGGSVILTGPGERTYVLEVDDVTGSAKLRRL